MPKPESSNRARVTCPCSTLRSTRIPRRLSFSAQVANAYPFDQNSFTRLAGAANSIVCFTAEYRKPLAASRAGTDGQYIKRSASETPISNPVFEIRA